MNNRTIDRGIATSAFLVCWTAGVPDHGDNEAVLNALAIVFIAGKPCDCTDRAWGEQETVAISRLQARHSLRQMREQRYPRAVIVRQRGMAYVGGKEKLVLCFALMQILTVR